MIDLLKRKWAEVSTKLGTGVLAVAGYMADHASDYASFDKRLAYVGLVAGALLVIFKEKRDGQ